MAAAGNWVVTLPHEVWAHEVLWHVAAGSIPVGPHAARPPAEWFRNLLAAHPPYAERWRRYTRAAAAILEPRRTSLTQRLADPTYTGPLCDLVEVMLISDPTVDDVEEDGFTNACYYVPVDEVIAAIQDGPRSSLTPLPSLAKVAARTNRLVKWLVLTHGIAGYSEVELVLEDLRPEQVYPAMLLARLRLMREMARDIVRDLRALAATCTVMQCEVQRLWPTIWQRLCRLSHATRATLDIHASTAETAIAQHKNAQLRNRSAEFAVLEELWPEQYVLGRTLIVTECQHVYERAPDLQPQVRVVADNIMRESNWGLRRVQDGGLYQRLLEQCDAVWKFGDQCENPPGRELGTLYLEYHVHNRDAPFARIGTSVEAVRFDTLIHAVRANPDGQRRQISETLRVPLLMSTVKTKLPVVITFLNGRELKQPDPKISLHTVRTAFEARTEAVIRAIVWKREKQLLAEHDDELALAVAQLRLPSPSEEVKRQRAASLQTLFQWVAATCHGRVRLPHCVTFWRSADLVTLLHDLRFGVLVRTKRDHTIDYYT